jgi:hypothetical protein
VGSSPIASTNQHQPTKQLLVRCQDIEADTCVMASGTRRVLLEIVRVKIPPFPRPTLGRIEVQFYCTGNGDTHQATNQPTHVMSRDIGGEVNAWVGRRRPHSDQDVVSCGRQRIVERSCVARYDKSTTSSSTATPQSSSSVVGHRLAWESTEHPPHLVVAPRVLPAFARTAHVQHAIRRDWRHRELQCQLPQGAAALTEHATES